MRRSTLTLWFSFFTTFAWLTRVTYCMPVCAWRLAPPKNRSAQHGARRSPAAPDMTLDRRLRTADHNDFAAFTLLSPFRFVQSICTYLCAPFRPRLCRERSGRRPDGDAERSTRGPSYSSVPARARRLTYQRGHRHRASFPSASSRALSLAPSRAQNRLESSRRPQRPRRHARQVSQPCLL